jgi:hypothetical protein
VSAERNGGDEPITARDQEDARNLDRLGSTAQLWLRAGNGAGPKQRRHHDSTREDAPQRPLLQYSGSSVAADMRTTFRERPMGLISQAWTNLAPPGADQGYRLAINPKPVDFVDNHNCLETARMETRSVLTAK